LRREIQSCGRGSKAIPFTQVRAGFLAYVRNKTGSLLRFAHKNAKIHKRDELPVKADPL
jgi:hypothetical protein